MSADPSGSMEAAAAPSERHLATASHLVALLNLGCPGLGLLGAALIWSIKGKESAFVGSHARESVNFQITMAIAFVVAMIGSMCLIFLGALDRMPDDRLIFAIPALPILLGLLGAILVCVAAYRAGGGESYRYPFAVRFFR
jgi:uncharacterized protein